MPTPEHLHLALNHLPVLLMPVAGLVTLWGLVRRHAEVVRVGLALTLLCALATPFVMITGEKACDNYDGADFIDSAGYAWMNTHGERAEAAAMAAYAAGATALAALTTGVLRRPGAGVWTNRISVLAVTAALLTAGLAVWTADAGGKIRRPDFRPSVQPTPTGQTTPSQ